MVKMPERWFMILSGVSFVTRHGIVSFEFGIVLIALIIQLTTPKKKQLFV